MDNKDNARDLIVIKPDNPLGEYLNESKKQRLGTEKVDLITELDVFDEIKVLGVPSKKISITYSTAHGLEGLGIYASGTLEALYIGEELTSDQVGSPEKVSSREK